MRATFTIFLAVTASTVFSQEFTFEYGDENYMNWHYNCSIDFGYTFKKKLPDGKYIELLDQAGYELKKFSLVDQFPHTAHVESVVLLERG